MHTDAFDSHTAALRALGGGRVWSLMISLFGDLAQDAEQSIDGPVLSAIMTGLHVKPEAARVALHRLRNDGWITSEKSGRISRHRLSTKGLQESAAASPRIYADPTQQEGAWNVVLTHDAADPRDMAQKGFVSILPRVFLAPAGVTPPKDALCLAGGQVPKWLRDQAEPVAWRDEYRALFETLCALEKGLPAATDLLPLQVAVLRCLIVHNWRRLVLKHPPLPAPLIDPKWPSHLCHEIVHDLLHRFPRPRLSEIGHPRAAA